MSGSYYYQQGYDKGHEHGLAGDGRRDSSLIDMFIPTTAEEDQWREEYEAGYIDGEAGR